MIHLALWILAACIVVPFFIVVIGGGLALLVRYWYVVAVIAVLGGVWLHRIGEENKLAAQRMNAQNQSKQQQCMADVNSKAVSLYRQYGYDTQRGAQITAVRSQAISSCKAKYPVY